MRLKNQSRICSTPLANSLNPTFPIRSISIKADGAIVTMPAKNMSQSHISYQVYFNLLPS